MNILDGTGLYGELLHYSLIFAYIGTALLALLYFWRRGRLAFDESPKHQMLLREDIDHDQPR